MANSYITSDLIAPRAQVYFELENTLLREAASDYQGLYKNGTYEPGDTVNIRLENHIESGRGDTATASDIVERKVPLTIQELYHAMVEIKPSDLQREIGDFTDHVMKPAVRKISSDINRDIFELATEQLYLYSGDTNAQVSTPVASDVPNTSMKEMGVPGADTWMQILSHIDAGALRGGLNNNFNQTVTKDVLATATLGHLGAFDVFEDQSIAIHDTFVGAIGTPLVNGIVASGTTIVADGFTASQTAILKKGDVVTFTKTGDNVYHVNPDSKLSTRRSYSAVVVADADSTAGGAVTFTVTEGVLPTGPNQNITASIPDNSVITVLGQTEGVYRNNVCYRPGGLVFVNPPMEIFRGDESKKVTGSSLGVSNSPLSLRVTFFAEPKINKQYMRIDTQVAYRWMPRWCNRLVSKA